jgi:cation/acetate symporter
MVGVEQLIKLLFGLDYWMAVVIVGALMAVIEEEDRDVERSG